MKYFLDKINNTVFAITNFEYAPVEGKEVEITEDEYNKFMDSFKYVPTEEDRLNSLRARRKVLLEAFDKYKSNVNYGIIVENEITRSIIVAWYNDLLDLKENAFEEIPEAIKYYL